ncbi:MAG: hypothetical protein AB7O37_04115 [Vicinamibacteria bacterium]
MTTRFPSVAAGAALAALLTLPAAVEAQDERSDVGVQASFTRYGEFDESEIGLGLKLGHRLARQLALDAELNLEPGGLGERSFSSNRFEALAGLRLGLDLQRSGAYLTLRGGVSRFAAAPEPIPCIAIFPPPLACVLAEGKTLPAFGFGAGFQALVGERAVLRLEIGDQMLRYPGPAFAEDRAIEDESFWRHNLRLTAGVGWRF